LRGEKGEGEGVRLEMDEFLGRRTEEGRMTGCLNSIYYYYY
jgi:hypothetical protein